MREGGFVDAVQAQPRRSGGDCGSLARIDELFGIDAEARARNLDHAARHALRLERVRAATGNLCNRRSRQLVLPPCLLPRWAKRRTIRSRFWPKLTRFLDYPELELSNNLAENSMRPVALGRKNWIHVGSPQAGPKVAAILSIVETCRRMKIPARDYMAAVLPGLAGIRIQRLAELTPAAWAARTP